MLSVKEDITVISDDYLKVITKLFLTLSTKGSLSILFVRSGLDLIRKLVLDADINLVNQLISGVSRACKTNLYKIYGV